MGLDMHFYKLEKSNLGHLIKANMIHYWIEKRILTKNPEIKEIYNNCYYELDYTDLQALLLDIKFVLKNPEFAREILPTRPGFFFGNLKYDESYYEILSKSENIIKNILDEKRKEDIILYNANW